MLIGIIGAPNKGKSTLFSALTMASAQIADYPFTTIKPNHGVAYVARECAEKGLGVKCAPKNSVCVNGLRYVPINIVDVAGLVPGAHLGRGMGNQFLGDAIAADMLIQVIDATGKTDLHGNPSEVSDPAEEVRMVVNELVYWVAGIVKKHISGVARRPDGIRAMHEMLAGLKVSESQISRAIEKSNLTSANISWSEQDIELFSRTLLKLSKPIVVAANKIDVADENALSRIRENLEGYQVVGCSAAIELALRKAQKLGVIDYQPGATEFKMHGEMSDGQRKALEYMKGFISEEDGTGIQQLLNKVVFETLGMIVVYPVEDENKYTDHYGNVLPDAMLVKNGSTAIELAAMIHTQIAKGMLYAIDARKKMRVNKEYILNDGDVIKIVSSAK
ncbi:MAG: redox-regulated ATPase YchF [Candidatus Micrarchaeota archaeon]|nr:redox-regulated ATPase YchF [Candidatus Micrarchaeota archaeon]MDE1848009.1 redox-regulated ATPase YchF [Candidatus Micrarchaeota archaeon]MDE1864614.1 redox-regulated ATPase YchF [Candidatus Micrarchaeota archaeon]